MGIENHTPASMHFETFKDEFSRVLECNRFGVRRQRLGCCPYNREWRLW